MAYQEFRLWLSTVNLLISSSYLQFIDKCASKAARQFVECLARLEKIV